MTKHIPSAPLRHNIFAGPYGHLIAHDAEDGGGADDAAKAAADKAAADKTASDKAAADKAAADKAAAEKDGDKSKLSDDAAKLLKENMDKKAALAKAEEEKAALAKQLKEFEGIDPAAVRKLLADQAAAEKKALEDKGDFDRVKKMMAEEHKKELDKLQAERDAANTEKSGLAKTINELTVGQAFLSSEFIKENLVLTPAKTRVIYGAHFEIENGQVIGYDKPAGADARTKLVDASGSPFNFEAALEHLIEKDPERDQMKKSKLAAGGGGKPSVAGKTAETVTGLTGAARMKAALEAAAAAKK